MCLLITVFPILLGSRKQKNLHLGQHWSNRNDGVHLLVRTSNTFTLQSVENVPSNDTFSDSVIAINFSRISRRGNANVQRQIFLGYHVAVMQMYSDKFSDAATKFPRKYHQIA